MLMVLHTGEKPYSPAQTTFTSFTFSGPLSGHVGSRGHRNDTPAGTAAILDIHKHALLSTCRTHRCSTFTFNTGELTGDKPPTSTQTPPGLQALMLQLQQLAVRTAHTTLMRDHRTQRQLETTEHNAGERPRSTTLV
ncbi:hypothetical protein Bbelb_365020 [Branchiostoma belcheri]|nr:hypothetical protein Bbelb_365020 [Branchiostoma belcheri]